MSCPNFSCLFSAPTLIPQCEGVPHLRCREGAGRHCLQWLESPPRLEVCSTHSTGQSHTDQTNKECCAEQVHSAMINVLDCGVFVPFQREEVMHDLDHRVLRYGNIVKQTGASCCHTNSTHPFPRTYATIHPHYELLKSYYGHLSASSQLGVACPAATERYN